MKSLLQPLQLLLLILSGWMNRDQQRVVHRPLFCQNRWARVECNEKPEYCQVAIDATRPGEMCLFFKSSVESFSQKRSSVGVNYHRYFH